MKTQELNALDARRRRMRRAALRSRFFADTAASWCVSHPFIARRSSRWDIFSTYRRINDRFFVFSLVFSPHVANPAARCRFVTRVACLRRNSRFRLSSVTRVAQALNARHRVQRYALDAARVASARSRFVSRAASAHAAAVLSRVFRAANSVARLARRLARAASDALASQP
jgi:hypothetical protein